MNQQGSETVKGLMDDENDEQDFFQFADLELTDEQLAEVKGGPGGGWGCTGCGVTNHNETTGSDEEEEDQEDFFQSADLTLTDEQAAQTQGGAVRVGKLLGVNY